MQFPHNLARPYLARVDYRQDLPPENCECPENGLVVAGIYGDTLMLDVLSDQFWQVEFDQIPPLDPNIRVEADELPNVFDIKSLRLIQWECDGTIPRLAGLYDLPGGVPFPIFNEFIDGVPNVKQKGVDVN